MTRIRPVAALALALAGAAPLGTAPLGTAPLGTAMASPDTSRAERRPAEAVTPGNAPFNAAAAISAVYGAGYDAVSELEWERGGWQVKATDTQGRRVELRVDATTGAVAPRGR